MYAGLEQDDIAAELEVSRSTVSRWEHGDPIKRGFVKVWAMRCGVPFEWLWDGFIPPGAQTGCTLLRVHVVADELVPRRRHGRSP